MKAENPAALRFILQDDIYLLPSDKTLVAKTIPEVIAEPTPIPAIENAPEPVTIAIPKLVVETPQVKLNYLGKHKKAFLIMVYYPDHEFIADAHLTALENILKRKEHAIDDVAILNMATSAITDFAELLTYFKPRKILMMGKNALPAKIEALTLNEPKQVAGLMALYSFSFDDMMSSNDNKKAFWDQMKNL